MSPGIPTFCYILFFVLESFIEFPAEVRLVFSPKGILFGFVVKVEHGDFFFWSDGREGGSLLLDEKKSTFEVRTADLF